MESFIQPNKWVYQQDPHEEIEPGFGYDAGETVIWSDVDLVGFIFEGDKDVAGVGGGGYCCADG